MGASLEPAPILIGILANFGDLVRIGWISADPEDSDPNFISISFAVNEPKPSLL